MKMKKNEYEEYIIDTTVLVLISLSFALSLLSGFIVNWGFPSSVVSLLFGVLLVRDKTKEKPRVRIVLLLLLAFYVSFNNANINTNWILSYVAMYTNSIASLIYATWTGSRAPKQKDLDFEFVLSVLYIAFIATIDIYLPINALQPSFGAFASAFLYGRFFLLQPKFIYLFLLLELILLVACIAAFDWVGVLATLLSALVVLLTRWIDCASLWAAGSDSAHA